MKENTGVFEKPSVSDYGYSASIGRELGIRWLDFLPDFEIQYKRRGKTRNAVFDTESCVSFAILNSIEMQLRYYTGKWYNFSDRWLAKISGTRKDYGNSANIVTQAARDAGLVQEDDYPFGGDTWEEYMQDIPLKVYGKAISFNGSGRFELRYKWLFTSADNLTHEQKLDRIMEALKTAPVVVSSPICPDWSRFKLTDKDNIVGWCGKKDGGHMTVLAAIDDEYQYRADHYEPYIKRCELDYHIQHAMSVVVIDKEYLGLLRKALSLAQQALSLVRKR